LKLSIETIKDRLSPIFKQYGILNAYLFGSYARGEATDNSDVDLRVDIGDLSGLKYSEFYVDVEAALSCKADILTTRQLPKTFLNHIRREEIKLYGN